MFVYIVMRNGDVDAVFTAEEAADNHVKNLQRKWNLTQILIREVRGYDG